jgi:hypothetical protein
MHSEECEPDLPGLRDLEEALFPDEVLQAGQDVHIANTSNAATIASLSGLWCYAR